MTRNSETTRHLCVGRVPPDKLWSVVRLIGNRVLKVKRGFRSYAAAVSALKALEKPHA